jgi:hypothetical protein
MKIYQLIVKTDEKDIVLGTFKNEDDALNGLADWTENYRAFNEALEMCATQEEEDIIANEVPEYFYPYDEKAHVIEFEVLDKYDCNLVKL